MTRMQIGDVEKARWQRYWCNIVGATGKVGENSHRNPRQVTFSACFFLCKVVCELACKSETEQGRGDEVSFIANIKNAVPNEL